MDRIGGFTVILATMHACVVRAAGSCRASRSAPAAPVASGSTTDIVDGASGEAAVSTGGKVDDTCASAGAWNAASSTAARPVDPACRRLAALESACRANRIPGRTAHHQPPIPPSRRLRTCRSRCRGRRTARSRANVAGPPAVQAEARAAGAERLRLTDQPRHRLAALRRSAADRGRRPGQRLGGRSPTHPGQGDLGPDD